MVGLWSEIFFFDQTPFWSLNGRDLGSNYRPIFEVGNLVGNLVIFSSECNHIFLVFLVFPIYCMAI